MPILHFGEHHKNALDPKYLEFTEAYGSKGGILEYLKSFPDLDDHILPGFSISHEQLASDSIPDLPANFKTIEKALIYRSSHPDDHRGYIGMLPTDISRHHKDTKILSPYDLPNHKLNLLKVYNALGYYQRYKKEITPRRSLTTDDYYNPRGYPLSDSKHSYSTPGGIDQNFAEFIEADPYGYHINYEKLYQNMLEKVKNGEDTTDYYDMASNIVQYNGSSYREMIRGIRGKIGNLTKYSESTGLRGGEKTGIYIQPEIIPDGSVTGGIYESPHKKGTYIVTYRTPTLQSDQQRNGNIAGNCIYAFDDNPTTFMFDSLTGQIDNIEGDAYYAHRFITTIIDLYTKVAKKNIFGENYSFHMEFGFQGNNPLIYQIRQFSPYQEADFSLGDYYRSTPIRGITDTVGEKVIFTLINLGPRNIRSDSEGRLYRYMKQEMRSGITSLRTMKLVGGTRGSRTNDDHGITKLLYETGGIAIAGSTIPWENKYNDCNGAINFQGTLYSDGTQVKIENLERLD